MEFTPLSARLSDLPLVLAGPMVRRVDPESFSVWLALREARDVRLVSDPKGAWQSDLTPTHEIGEFLHLVVVTARPSPPAAAGDVLHYNIEFSPPGDNTTAPDNLFTPKIVAKNTNDALDLLTYPSDTNRTPSFMVPPASILELRILHSSCRHIEGNGTDAFPAYDHLLEEHLKNRGTILRPAMLFLTGDQIYADGSGRELLDILTDIGDTLLGQDETLPVVESVPGDLPRSRMVIAVDDAGLKNPREFPALALGEFIALYLLTFSDVLWPPESDKNEDLKRFREGLPATRRVFANLATYMIFDDHEFSDSFYLTFSWIAPLIQSDLGRRFLQNGFTAYALCQGWGNTPEQFAPPVAPATKDPPGLVLLKALEKWKKIGFAAESDEEEQIQQVLGIPDFETFVSAGHDLSNVLFHGPETLRWHYTVPCEAAAINVLDTYTWKSFEGEFDPADHLPADALDKQVSRIGNQSVAVYVISNVGIMRTPRLMDPGSFSDAIKGSIVTYGALAIVAGISFYLLSVPVFLIILGVVLGFVAFVKKIGDSHGVVGWLKSTEGRIPSLAWVNRALRTVHYEEVGTEFEWHSPAFERLLDRTARESARQIGGEQLARVLFLSGDVHESYAMRLSYFADFDEKLINGTPGLRAVFAQLVSSPTKRRDEGDASYEENSSGEFVGWKRSKEEENDEPDQLSGDEEVTWLHKGEFWVARINEDLPIFDDRGNHRYRIEPIKPTSQTVKISTLAPNPPPTFQGYLAKLEVHQRLLLTRLGSPPIVSINNVSDVTFPSTTTVRQDVWWRFGGLESQPPAWFTKTYEVDLTPPQPPSMPEP
jgi:hypothetical protein